MAYICLNCPIILLTILLLQASLLYYYTYHYWLNRSADIQSDLNQKIISINQPSGPQQTPQTTDNIERNQAEETLKISDDETDWQEHKTVKKEGLDYSESESNETNGEVREERFMPSYLPDYSEDEKNK